MKLNPQNLERIAADTLGHYSRRAEDYSQVLGRARVEDKAINFDELVRETA